ncbi:MAG: sensor histidine kinase [Flavobacteriales bacterium]
MNNVTFRHFMLVIDLNFLVYFAMLGIIYGYYYLQKIKGIEAQKNRLQQQLINSKMNVLKSQLHPHFVFNTLNSISSLIDIDKNKSQNLIADFGDLFRGILEIKNEHLIPLEKEINLLDKYIDIISVRFSDHLIINKNIEEELKDCLVPNMIIQPLLENAIKHGYSYNKTNLIIDLSIFKKEKYLIIIIENDGDLLNEKFNELLGLGTGIRTTQERLYTLFGSNFKFILKNNKAKTGVLAFIKIPLKTVLINTPSQW